MKHRIYEFRSEYLKPEANLLEMRAAGILCASEIHHLSPLPSWQEKEEDMIW